MRKFRSFFASFRSPGNDFLIRESPSFSIWSRMLRSESSTSQRCCKCSAMVRPDTFPSFTRSTTNCSISFAFTSEVNRYPWVYPERLAIIAATSPAESFSASSRVCTRESPNASLTCQVVSRLSLSRLSSTTRY